MDITPERIIEEIVDLLALGELGQSVDAFTLTRLAPDALLLDYGQGRAFVVRVDASLGTVSGHATADGS